MRLALDGPIKGISSSSSFGVFAMLRMLPRDLRRPWASLRDIPGIAIRLAILRSPTDLLATVDDRCSGF